MNIPYKVITRLTLYHSILEDYKEEDTEYISSSYIASLLDIDNSQVRKDIKYLNNTGKCRVGYKVKELKSAIEETLGFEQMQDAFIVGAGNLGSAIAKYDGFKSYGLNILALFDNDPLKVGILINGKEVFPLSELENLVERLKVNIAILTVPRECAQECAEYLVKSGIKCIWNFTPSILKLDKNVKIWNENLIGSFIQFKNTSKDEELYD